MKIIQTDFSPTINGFKFINIFDYKLLLKVRCNFKKRLFLGLCGGMIFSALDYFYSEIIRPEFNSTDEFDNKFIDYLWKRQLDSVAANTLIRLIFHGVSSNKHLINQVIYKEIPTIIENINKNFPVPVVIVRNHFFENPTNNHQLLLVSCSIDRHITHFRCYDPNHPLQTPTITINRASGQESITYSTGEAVRGFFINNYRYQQPFIYDNASKEE